MQIRVKEVSKTLVIATLLCLVAGTGSSIKNQHIILGSDQSHDAGTAGCCKSRNHVSIALTDP